MSEEIDTRVTPSLHPRNVQEVDGYCEEVAGILQSTEAAFTVAYQGLTAIHNAREASKRNPAWTDAAALVETADYADKVVEGITRAFHSASANLKIIVTGLEKELSAPVEASTHGVLSGEIRAHVKGLEPAARIGFVRSLIVEGDRRSVESILGGPAFLSGLDTDMQAILLRMYREAVEPVKANRLKAAKGAMDLIDQRAGLIFTEMEKAVGVLEVTEEGRGGHRIVVKRLTPGEARKQIKAAQKSFTLPNS